MNVAMTLEDYELEVIGFLSAWKIGLCIVVQCMPAKKRQQVIVGMEIELDLRSGTYTMRNLMRNQSPNKRSSLRAKCGRFAATLRAKSSVASISPHILKSADLRSMKSLDVVASPIHPIAIALQEKKDETLT